MSSSEFPASGASFSVNTLNAYLDKAPIGISVIDREGMIIYVNHAAMILSGYDYDTVMGMPIFNLILPDYHEVVFRQIEHLSTNLEPIEVKVITGNKDERSVLVQSALMDDGNIVSFLLDISSQKNTQASLKLQSLVLDQIFARVTITDLAGNITNVNKAECKALGYTEAELKAMNVRDYGEDPQIGATQHEILSKTLSDGSWGGIVATFAKDGSEVLMDVRTSMVIDDRGKPIALCGVSTDITEQVKKDRRMAYQVELEHQIMDLSNSLVNAKIEEFDDIINASLHKIGCFMGLDRGYIFFLDYEAQVANNIYEWCAEGIEPQLDQLQGLPFDFAPNWMQQMYAKQCVVIDDIDALPDEWAPEKELLKSQDIQSLLSAPIAYRQKLQGFLGFDAVRSKRIWQNEDIGFMRMLADLVSGAIERRKTELELIRAKEKAEESNRLKSAFLATMNHELRTPLNHIMGFAQLLEFETSAEETAYFASQIKKSGNDLLKIIKDIFDLALAEQSQIKPHIQSFDCMAHFLENKDILQEILQASGKQQQIELKFSPDLSIIRSQMSADISKINQVLLNLFKNAVKFTHEGFIEFGFRQSATNLIHYYIKDSGIGIPQSKQSMIFEFFCQADDSNTRLYGGVGIGLAISKRLGEIMGGRLLLESQEGFGSTFTLEVPVRIATKTDFRKLEAMAAQEVPDLSNLSILIVDDDIESLFITKSYLKKTAAHIYEAVDGIEALRMYSQYQSINLVLMDIQMPIMDGYTATKKLKEQNPDLRVIALTAFVEEYQVSDFKSMDFDAVLTKPIQREALYCMLSRYV